MTRTVKVITVRLRGVYCCGIFSLTLITLTACAIYMAVFKILKSSHHQYDCFLTVDLVVILTLAFDIQTRTSFLEYQKQVIFNMTLFEGGSRSQTNI